MTTMPPLIVHIVYRFDIGGLESVLVNMINTMPRNAYRHTIISLTESSEFERRIERDDVEVICLHKKAGNDFKIHLKIWQLLRQLKPSIVHSYNIATLEYQVIAFLAGVKQRLHAEHGRDIYDLKGDNKKYQYLRRLINPFISKWVAVSKELHDWLIETVQLPNQKVQLIYNGIDLALYQQKPRKKNHDFMMGTVGRLAAVKDQLTLIKAVEQLIQQYPALKNSVKLILVGDGELYDDLNQSIIAADLQDNVELLGARNDVAAILQTFDVFVLPSLAEGIPLTILEAMATALPVITTNVGGNPELITENSNGFLIEPKDIDVLVRQLKYYYDFPERIKQHGLQGRKIVEERFSVEAMTKQYLQLYLKT